MTHSLIYPGIHLDRVEVASLVEVPYSAWVHQVHLRHLH